MVVLIHEGTAVVALVEGEPLCRDGKVHVFTGTVETRAEHERDQGQSGESVAATARELANALYPEGDERRVAAHMLLQRWLAGE